MLAPVRQAIAFKMHSHESRAWQWCRDEAKWNILQHCVAVDNHARPDVHFALTNQQGGGTYCEQHVDSKDGFDHARIPITQEQSI